MKVLKFGAIAAACLLAAGSVSAVTYTDVQSLNVLLNSSTPYNGSLNLVSPGSSSVNISGYLEGNGTFTDAGGYVPGSSLTSAILRFYFEDDASNDGDEEVEIDLESQNNLVNGFELNSGNGAKTVISFTNITPGGSPNFFAALVADGQLGFSVKRDEGDFKLKYVLLTATGPAGVPDGASTIALLGVSILGLAQLRRRFMR